MRRIPLDMYDENIPEEMRRYLKHNGWHFNKKACDFAVGLMRKKNMATGRVEKIEALSKEQVDAMLTKFGVTIENSFDYDYVYIANLAKAKFLKGSIPDEQHLVMYVKEVIDDPTAGDGEVMRAWDSRMTALGIPTEWDEIL